MTEVKLEQLVNGAMVVTTITLDLNQDFSLDPTNLENDMTFISNRLGFYGDLASELQAQAARHKLNAEAVYAREAISIRESGTKYTDAAVKERVASNVAYMKACEQQIESEKYFRKVENLFKSLKDKTNLAIAICYKQNSEIKSLSFSN